MLRSFRTSWDDKLKWLSKLVIFALCASIFNFLWIATTSAKSRNDEPKITRLPRVASNSRNDEPGITRLPRVASNSRNDEPKITRLPRVASNSRNDKPRIMRLLLLLRSLAMTMWVYCHCEQSEAIHKPPIFIHSHKNKRISYILSLLSLLGVKRQSNPQTTNNKHKNMK